VTSRFFITKVVYVQHRHHTNTNTRFHGDFLIHLMMSQRLIWVFQMTTFCVGTASNRKKILPKVLFE